MFYAEFLPYVRDYYNVVTGGGIHWHNERYQSLLTGCEAALQYILSQEPSKSAARVELLLKGALS